MARGQSCLLLFFCQSEHSHSSSIFYGFHRPRQAPKRYEKVFLAFDSETTVPEQHYECRKRKIGWKMNKWWGIIDPDYFEIWKGLFFDRRQLLLYLTQLRQNLGLYDFFRLQNWKVEFILNILRPIWCNLVKFWARYDWKGEGTETQVVYLEHRKRKW